MSIVKAIAALAENIVVNVAFVWFIADIVYTLHVHKYEKELKELKSQLSAMVEALSEIVKGSDE